MMNMTATLRQIATSLNGRSRLFFIISVLFFVLTTVLRVLAPIIFASIIVSAQDMLDGAGWGICVYAILFFVTRLLEEIRFAFYVSFEQEVQKVLALRTIDIFFQIPFSSSRAKSPSENAIAVDRGLSGLRAVLYNGVFAIAPVIVEAAVLLVIIGFRISLFMAVWGFIVLGAFLWATTYFSEKTRLLQEKWFAIASTNYKILSESLRSYETIRSFDQATWVRQRYGDATDGFIEKVIVSLRPGIFLGAVQGVLLAILVGSMVGAVMVSDLATTEKISTFVLVNGLLLQIISPLLQFSGAYQMFIQGLASARQLLDLLNSQPVPAKIQHQSLDGEDEFRLVDLCVDYDGMAVLNVDRLSIPQHRLVSLSGASGSGKSTLARCLAGLSEHGGTIYSRLGSDRIFYMTQDIHIFDISIEENIALGLPVNPVKMQWALEKAGISADELRLLSDRGIGEGGMNVSGGQRQRIGLARMLYHDAEVLIFDEPTSALDADTAHRVLSTLRAIGTERTCIIITHDQRCVDAASINIELAHGRIIQMRCN